MPLNLTELREKYELAWGAALNDERLSFVEWLIVELERLSPLARFDGEKLHTVLTCALDWIPAHATVRPEIIKTLTTPGRQVSLGSTTDVLPHVDQALCPTYHAGCHCRDVLELWATGDWAVRKTR